MGWSVFGLISRYESHVLMFTHFIAVYDQNLENRIDFVLPNLVVQPYPLMSDERSSTNDHSDTADYLGTHLSYYG